MEPLIHSQENYDPSGEEIEGAQAPDIDSTQPEFQAGPYHNAVFDNPETAVEMEFAVHSQVEAEAYGTGGETGPATSLNLLSLYISQASRAPLLSRDEERELAHQVKSGDAEAKNRLIESNLRLVISIAKKYRGMGVEFLDLIQEGSEALIGIIARFDPEKARFTTFATPTLHGRMKRVLDNNKQTIRMGSESGSEVRRIAKAERALQQKLGRQPSQHEIAEESGLSVEQLQHHGSMRGSTASLDKPIGIDEGEETLGSRLSNGDSLEDRAISQVGEEVFVRELLSELTRLSIIERTVFRERYLEPVYGSEPPTMESLARKLNVSHQAIKAAETRAVRKLGRSSTLQQLASVPRS